MLTVYHLSQQNGDLEHATDFFDHNRKFLEGLTKVNIKALMYLLSNEVAGQ